MWGTWGAQNHGVLKLAEVSGFPVSLEVGFGVRPFGVWLQCRTKGQAKTWERKTYLFQEMEQGEEGKKAGEERAVLCGPDR